MAVSLKFGVVQQHRHCRNFWFQPHEFSEITRRWYRWLQQNLEHHNSRVTLRCPSWLRLFLEADATFFSQPSYLGSGRKNSQSSRPFPPERPAGCLVGSGGGSRATSCQPAESRMGTLALGTVTLYGNLSGPRRSQERNNVEGNIWNCQWRNSVNEVKPGSINWWWILRIGRWTDPDHTSPLQTRLSIEDCDVLCSLCVILVLNFF